MFDWSLSVHMMAQKFYFEIYKLMWKLQNTKGIGACKIFFLDELPWGHTKKNAVFPLTLWGKKIGKVGRKWILFLFLILFPVQVNTLQIQTQLWEFSLNWTKALFPVSIEPLCTCRTAHIFALVANTERCVLYFWNQLDFFLSGSIKFLGSGLNLRVGRVSGNTTFFCMAWWQISKSMHL
jgi:hypothetical protein